MYKGRKEEVLLELMKVFMDKLSIVVGVEGGYNLKCYFFILFWFNKIIGDF